MNNRYWHMNHWSTMTPEGKASLDEWLEQKLKNQKNLAILDPSLK
jgi:hypothetical protein